jgi:hypothetical protein
MVNVMRNTWGAIGKTWAVAVLPMWPALLSADDLPRRGFIGVVLAPLPDMLRAKLPVPAGRCSFLRSATAFVKAGAMIAEHYVRVTEGSLSCGS